MTATETVNSGRKFLKSVRQSFSFKLGLAVGLIFLVAVLAFTFYLVSLQEQQAFERMAMNVNQWRSVWHNSPFFREVSTRPTNERQMLAIAAHWPAENGR